MMMRECSWCEELIAEGNEHLESEYVLGRYCSRQCVRDAEEDAERRHMWQQLPYNYED